MVSGKSLRQHRSRVQDFSKKCRRLCRERVVDSKRPRTRFVPNRLARAMLASWRLAPNIFARGLWPQAENSCTLQLDFKKSCTLLPEPQKYVCANVCLQTWRQSLWREFRFACELCLECFLQTWRQSLRCEFRQSAPIGDWPRK